MLSSKNRKVLLTLNSGEISYGHFPVLSLEKLEVVSSTVSIIKGTNGSGKTSLFRAIAGIQAESSGDIILSNRRLNNMAPQRRFRHGIRFIPQDRQVFNRLTFEEHFEVAGNSKLALRKRNSEIPVEFRTVAKLIGNTNKHGISLSGGQVKIMLLLSLTQQTPKILMLDEPFAGLDDTAKELIEPIVNQCLSSGGACLISDHTGFAEKYLSPDRILNLFSSSEFSETHKSPFMLKVI